MLCKYLHIHQFTETEIKSCVQKINWSQLRASWNYANLSIQYTKHIKVCILYTKHIKVCNLYTKHIKVCNLFVNFKWKWNETTSAYSYYQFDRGRRGRDRIIVGFITTCTTSAYNNTNVVSLNHVYGEEYSIQHYVIKFVSDLQQVVGFLKVLQFPPLKKLTATT